MAAQQSDLTANTSGTFLVLQAFYRSIEHHGVKVALSFIPLLQCHKCRLLRFAFFLGDTRVILRVSAAPLCKCSGAVEHMHT